MTKNKMMRIASVLLVAVLLSTCAISGTFAKYVTEATGTDSARVAKWGVKVEIDNDLNLFDETYATTDTTIDDNTITNSVAVNTAGTNLVAPGTNNSIDFSISGTPEVAVEVAIQMTVNSDVIIPSGTEVAENNTLADDYTPVVFTLKKSDGSIVASGTLSEIETGLEALSDEYAPNTTLDETYTLSWEWAFSGTNTNDAADTYLGNVAAGTVTDANTKIVLDFEFTITVTQID